MALRFSCCTSWENIEPKETSVTNRRKTTMRDRRSWQRSWRSAPAWPIAGGALGSDNEKQAFLNDAAKRLDVTPAQLEGGPPGRLRRAYRRSRRGRQDHEGAGRGDEAAVEGRRTAALRRSGTRRLRRPRPSRWVRARHRQVARCGRDVSRPDRGGAARRARWPGKTLAEIAKAQGKSVAGLKAALKADAKTKLDAAVKARPHHAGAGRRDAEPR